MVDYEMTSSCCRTKELIVGRSTQQVAPAVRRGGYSRDRARNATPLNPGRRPSVRYGRSGGVC